MRRARCRGARCSWRKSTGASRAGFLRAIASKVKEQREALGRLETLDNGKPISEALWDIVSSLPLPRVVLGITAVSGAPWGAQGRWSLTITKMVNRRIRPLYGCLPCML